MKNILFFTDSYADYLVDSVFHGLKSLTNDFKVYDYPYKPCMYKSSKDSSMGVYGKGFSLYNLLPEDGLSQKVDITNQLLKGDFFDIIIVGTLERQYHFYLKYFDLLKKHKTIILDGRDSPQLFLNHKSLERYKPLFWFFPVPHKHFLYFKREWIEKKTNRFRFKKLLPPFYKGSLVKLKNLRPISFAIPKEKIVDSLPQKTKMFPSHIVDTEVAKKINAQTSYAFDDEKCYYKDLQSSRYGITTKRAGWDCMRHYKIAANGTVPCFRDLTKKPKNCAPHGLIPNVNCISYTNYDDLMSQIEKIDVYILNFKKMLSLGQMKTPQKNSLKT